MQSQAAAPQGAGHYPNPYLVYGAPSGFAPLTDEAGVYLWIGNPFRGVFFSETEAGLPELDRAHVA